MWVFGEEIKGECFEVRAGIEDERGRDGSAGDDVGAGERELEIAAGVADDDVELLGGGHARSAVVRGDDADAVDTAALSGGGAPIEDAAAGIDGGTGGGARSEAEHDGLRGQIDVGGGGLEGDGLAFVDGAIGNWRDDGWGVVVRNGDAEGARGTEARRAVVEDLDGEVVAGGAAAFGGGPGDATSVWMDDGADRRVGHETECEFIVVGIGRDGEDVERFAFAKNTVGDEFEDGGAVDFSDGGARIRSDGCVFTIAGGVGGDAVEGVGTVEAALVNGALIDGLFEPKREGAVIDGNEDVVEGDAAAALIVGAGPIHDEARGAVGGKLSDGAGGRGYVASGDRDVVESVSAGTVVVEEVQIVFEDRTTRVAEERAVGGP